MGTLITLDNMSLYTSLTKKYVDDTISKKTIKKPSGTQTSGKFLTVGADNEPMWGNAANDGQITAAVTNWLNENIIGSNNVAVDTSLKTSGAAADAAITGLIFNAETGNVLDDTEWIAGKSNIVNATEGSVFDPTSITESTYIKSKIITIDPGSYTHMILNVFSVGYGFLKDDNIVVDVVNNNAFFNNKVIEIPSEATKIIITNSVRENYKPKNYYCILGRPLNDRVKTIENIIEDSIPAKKERTGNYEFFTVPVTRPLFEDENINSAEQNIECVLRLPTTYSPTGTPTRLVLACHESGGYIKETTTAWSSTDWKNFVKYLVNNGYAVFDANVLPSSETTDVVGECVGSPLFVNAAHKAYNYIQENYNVYKEIFVHGSQMGGTSASAFVNAYPNIVLAESSFGGYDITRYMYLLWNNDPAISNIAKPWEYSDTTSLRNDGWSRILGTAPSLSLIKYQKEPNQIVFPDTREGSFDSWLQYYSSLYNSSVDENVLSQYNYIAHRTVPYKTWESESDESLNLRAKQILQKAFLFGGTAPYEVVTGELNATDLCYGNNSMREQLINWYKRWE